jgi:hypothetical protein
MEMLKRLICIAVYLNFVYVLAMIILGG